MKSYTVDEIREMYLDFFRNKDHKILPSASLIPHGDPTLLLTVAGMVPFKKYFLGLEKPEYPRVATCQRCIRTGDIENVGKTDRHGTFFEMLGNFSFGDYFKKEIIPWSWEFVTEYLGFPKEKLWVTIYQNDDEADEIWRNAVGVPPERIVRLGKEDNFWETGSGPCGPCSEIHIDRGPEFGCGSPDCKPGCECDRYLEFWNLVFIQYHQEGDKYIPLEKRSIDTGMGLERVATLLQGKTSIFEIDNMSPIVDGVADIAKTPYGVDPKHDVSLRVITDHLRAIAFLIMDGVLPSNEGRGYVLRRLLRRAVRHGRLLGIDGSFLGEGIDLVVEQMKKPYPELLERQDFIRKVVHLEEQRFSETLDQGMTLLQDLVEKAEKAGVTQIPGTDVFQLYDTFGFPIELTREILAEHGMVVDEEGFKNEMEAQRERARLSRTAHGYLDTSLEAYKDLAGTVAVDFVGYEHSEADGTLLGIIQGDKTVDEAGAGDEVALVLDKTPFYAESGGQVGDTGCITTPTGKVRIEDVQEPVEGLVSHIGKVVEGTIKVGSGATASIDLEKRIETARHHTVTHLLHRVLKDTLGEHVNQAGSYVSPDRLRFDFTHFEAVTPKVLREIEDKVNQSILMNYPVAAEIAHMAEAKKQGAVALFGEKYGDVVRMIKIGDFSLELCGGTHVKATGDIGLFKILSEGSVAAGVRRIEAVAGSEALAFIREREEILEEIHRRIQGPIGELPAQIDKMVEHIKALEKELSLYKQKAVLSSTDDLLSEVEKIGEVSLLVSEVNAANPEELRVMGDRLRDKLDPALILLGARDKDKVLLLSMASKALTGKGIHAGKVVKETAQICGGGGGGRPDMAQAGGRNPDKLPQALEHGRQIFKKQMEGIEG